MEFLTSKFNELEKERKEKDELINSLEIKFRKQIFKSFLKVKVKNIQKKANDREEYSHRSCLLTHGFDDRKTEDTGGRVLYVINYKLNIEVSLTSIDRSHRLEKRTGHV